MSQHSNTSPPASSKWGATSIWNLVKERGKRDAIYGTPTYWDARASARSGLSRSIWPSNVFNHFWDLRQRELLRRALGSLTGRTIADVGCGTGRMSRFFADEGAAEVVGIDFSESTVVAAREDTSQPAVSFVQGDVVAGLDHVGVEKFDDVVVLGCLSVACRDLVGLERAMKNIARLAKPGGRVLILEPIHRSPLLRRILNLGLEDWIGVANRAGLDLRSGDRMGFVPVRLFFSVRDLPDFLVGTVFSAGEKLLDWAPYLAPMSDYKLLLFDAPNREENKDIPGSAA